MCAYATALRDPGAAGGMRMDMYCTKSPTVPPAQFMLNVEPRSAGPNCPLSNVRPWQVPQAWSYATLPCADWPAVYSTAVPPTGFTGAGFTGAGTCAFRPRYITTKPAATLINRLILFISQSQRNCIEHCAACYSHRVGSKGGRSAGN